DGRTRRSSQRDRAELIAFQHGACDWPRVGRTHHRLAGRRSTLPAERSQLYSCDRRAGLNRHERPARAILPAKQATRYAETKHLAEPGRGSYLRQTHASRVAGHRGNRRRLPVRINFNVMLPLFATDVLHSGAAGFGFISAAFGLGSLFSALWIAWGNNRPSIRFMLLGTLAFCVLEILFALSPIYPLSLLLIAGVGFAQITLSAVANTTIQTIAPNHLRGRVMSVYMLVFAGSVPLGNLFAGGLAHLYGAPISLLVGGGLALIAAIVG